MRQASDMLSRQLQRALSRGGNPAAAAVGAVRQQLTGAVCPPTLTSFSMGVCCSAMIPPVILASGCGWRGAGFRLRIIVATDPLGLCSLSPPPTTTGGRDAAGGLAASSNQVREDDRDEKCLNPTSALALRHKNA